MLLLAIDTSTRRIGVALGGEHGVTASLTLGGGDPSDRLRPRHAEQLIPAVQYLLAESGVTLGALDAIALSVGPGAFTGLRVGITTAKVLAQVCGLALVPVPSLDLVAHPLLAVGDGDVIAALDARRHEVYWARYRRSGERGGTDDTIERVSDYELSTPALLVEAIERAAVAVRCAGDGAIRFAAELAAHPLVEVLGPAHGAPDLAALVALGVAGVETGATVAPDAVVPLYLRGSDAQLARERREAGGAAS